MKDNDKFHTVQQEAAHERIYKKFSGLVKGTISGFDRIVFKGLILPLMSSREVMSFRSLRLSVDPEVSLIKTINNG